jgi:hypothetical protein
MSMLPQKTPHLLHSPEPQSRRGRPPDQLADGLLERFYFVRHKRKLRQSARTVNDLADLSFAGISRTGASR